MAVTIEATARARSSYASRVPASVLRGHMIMGVIQMAVGFLVILLCIIGLAVRTDDNMVLSGSGIWSGPFFIIAGVCGVLAGNGVRLCTLCCVISCLVFCIIASILGFTALVLESVFTSWNLDRYESRSNRYSHGPQISHDDAVAFRAVNATSIICILLFALEFLLAIVHTAFACRASCCCVPRAAPRPYHQQRVYLGQQARYTGQSIVYPGQVIATYPSQQVSYVGQPVVGYSGQQPAYVGQQAPGYPAQQAPGYPAQQAPGYPGQQAPGYPGQQAAGYSGDQLAPRQQPPPNQATSEPAKF